ncbi:MAG: hypothetical protein R3Y16_02155 [Rikenellaceae bacterium]
MNIAKSLRLSLFAFLAICSAHISLAADGKHTEHITDSFVNYYKKGIDEKLYIQCDKPYYSAGEKIWLKGYLRNAITHRPLELSNYIFVELTDREGELVSRVKVLRDSTGFSGYLSLAAEMDEGDYTLRGYTRWMTNKDEEFFFTKNIKVISPVSGIYGEQANKESNRAKAKREAEEAEEEAEEAARMSEYSVQFFAEGGALVGGMSHIIAFKALAQDGLSVEVKGQIFNSKGEVVGSISSIHKGMGMVTMFVEKGESYYAVVENEEGLERRFSLPEVESKGVTVVASRSGDKLFYQAKSSDAKLLKNAYAVVHTRGQVVTVDEGDMTKTHLIPYDMLEAGVTTITIMNGDNEPLAERLIFKKPSDMATISIECDKRNYTSRSLARVKLNIKNSLGEAAQGEFGVSVTDNLVVKSDPTTDNIVSYLLLSSDIKGHIEEPGFYFARNTAEEDYKLDLLMRTQGWRRFDIKDVVSNSIPDPKVNYEESGTISGRVKGFFGNDARNPNIMVICSRVGFVDFFEYNSSGFSLTGLNIPDSAVYVVQAKGRNGGTALSLEVDTESFPEPLKGIFARKGANNESSSTSYIPTSFVQQSQEKFIHEGGMSTIDIDAVSVSTSKPTSSGTGLFATHSTGREELDALASMPLSNFLQTYPNMTVESDGVLYRDNEDYAGFVVDGMEMEFFEVEVFTTADIESISFLTDSEAVLYRNADGGVFVIELREDYISSVKSAANVASVRHLGYQERATFYQPSYDKEEVAEQEMPDYRTTVFWSGELTPDEEGNIEFEFFTADKATSYTIEVEGVTEEGEPCRATKTIDRTLL